MMRRGDGAHSADVADLEMLARGVVDKLQTFNRSSAAVHNAFSLDGWQHHPFLFWVFQSVT